MVEDLIITKFKTRFPDLKKKGARKKSPIKMIFYNHLEHYEHDFVIEIIFSYFPMLMKIYCHWFLFQRLLSYQFRSPVEKIYTYTKKCDAFLAILLF